jgi:hypothetical protein
MAGENTGAAMRTALSGPIGGDKEEELRRRSEFAGCG